MFRHDRGDQHRHCPAQQIGRRSLSLFRPDGAVTAGGSVDAGRRHWPTRQVVDRVGDKWTLLVIHALEEGPARFSALQTRIQGLNQKVLTTVLRGLERDGPVTRTVFPTIPPKVEYELTDLGQSLLGVVGGIRSWAYERMDDILKARESYDAAAR
ncbi:winged helix-turn-helix transcriptional regulator [Actinoplanes sp. NPDC020271]|uniref:winged helix-turn-helix transcriptional regulator n=1 Tax=Actinoplanes sp. NPDC020271 TaxID=3363896 RepID=UPI00378B3785